VALCGVGAALSVEQPAQVGSARWRPGIDHRRAFRS
jgi:hypothetical protein